MTYLILGMCVIYIILMGLEVYYLILSQCLDLGVVLLSTTDVECHPCLVPGLHAGGGR